VYLTSV